jgi:hypothetical protein
MSIGCSAVRVAWGHVRGSGSVLVVFPVHGASILRRGGDEARMKQAYGQGAKSKQQVSRSEERKAPGLSPFAHPRVQARAVWQDG